MIPENEKYICDIEVYPNFFFVGLKNYYSHECISFEISETVDQRKDLQRWFNEYRGFLITFNGLHYDEVVINYAVKNSTRSLMIWLKEVDRFSQQVIDEVIDKNDKFFKKNYTSIDLMQYWSKKLRIAKKINLKSLGIQLNYSTVQELPYPPGSFLTETQQAEVKHYNLVHDLSITYQLCIKMIDQILLRKELGNFYGIKCWSYSPTKIASEILLKKFCEKTGRDKKEVKAVSYSPSPYLIGDYLPKVTFETAFFQKLYHEIRKSTRDFSKTFIYPVKNRYIKIAMGIGGIHTEQKDEVYNSDSKIILDIDIASLYPRFLLNYKFIRPELYPVLDVYEEITNERLKAKKLKLKFRDEALKLIINSTTGLIDTTGWMYSPEQILALRILGQLTLLRAVEILTEYEIFSLNTDGLTLYVDPVDLETVYAKIAQVEHEFGCKFEYKKYKWIKYKSVNSYIALDEDGEIKKKGSFFRTKIPLGDSSNFLIIPKSLELYFVKGISPQEIMKDPEKYEMTIFDFCASKKVSKKYTVYWNQIPQQRINRYFASKTGAYLYCNSNHMLKESPVQLLNNYKGESIKEFDINYSFYLQKINQVINDLSYKPTLF